MRLNLARRTTSGPQRPINNEMITDAFQAAEFFAGIGLVRLALEQEGFEVVFANDIEPAKCEMYSANFGNANFVLGDVRNIKGRDLPRIDLATASFPCTDLSLAGNRAGLNGKESGMFWEFARILDEMGDRRPRALLIENVTGFATSRGGADLASAIERLNELGYACDVFTIDARMFVPQSRARLFIAGFMDALSEYDAQPSCLRPEWIHAFVQSYPALKMQLLPLRTPAPAGTMLSDYIERIPNLDSRWWDSDRLSRFSESLSPVQSERLYALKGGSKRICATAYRRTRQGRAVWEIRPDGIAGCLRTAKGGSGRQALVEAGRGRIRARWMTSREYANLQGAPHFRLNGARENEALSAFGDGVCVPVIAWIAREYLRPLLLRTSRGL
jgi:DNA (cytosine-5)-methyltransferase 1